MQGYAFRCMRACVHACVREFVRVWGLCNSGLMSTDSISADKLQVLTVVQGLFVVVSRLVSKHYIMSSLTTYPWPLAFNSQPPRHLVSHLKALGLRPRFPTGQRSVFRPLLAIPLVSRAPRVCALPWKHGRHAWWRQGRDIPTTAPLTVRRHRPSRSALVYPRWRSLFIVVVQVAGRGGG